MQSLNLPKRHKQLDKRLTAIAGLVRDGAVVCDVGTDHAYLPCYLSRLGKHRRIYACDLNEGPLEFARATIEKQKQELKSDVILLQSNGLQRVPPPENGQICDVIIAGMGGELIAEIIANMPPGFKNDDLRLILQPMTKQQDLRQALLTTGYEIILEKEVSENNRIFTIIYSKEKTHDHS